MTTPEQRKSFYERHPNYSRDYMAAKRAAAKMEEELEDIGTTAIRWNKEPLMEITPTMNEDPDQITEWTTAMECQFLRNLYHRYGFNVLRRQAANILSGMRRYDPPVNVEKVKLSVSKLLFKASGEEEELERKFR